jgi:hypothetical protein
VSAASRLLVPAVLVASTARAGPSAALPPPYVRSAAPAASSLSLRGSGLFTVPDADVLGRGRVLAGIAVDNRDRDPLGLDLLDGAIIAAAGLGAGLELYGNVVRTRVVALPENPPLPPPPLDLVLVAPARVPPRPYYAIYPLVPYVNHRGTARFDAWVPGDAVFGLRRRLWRARGVRPALALAGELTLPLTRELSLMQSGAGTGATDGAVRIVLGWGDTSTRVLASFLYTRTGRPPVDDRLIVADRAGSARVEDVALTLPDRLESSVGVRRPLSAALAAVAEATAVIEVGARTPTLDAAPPLDLIAGVQGRWGHARIGAALRYHGRALSSGARRPSPLAGFVDLTDVAPDALAAYLERAGARAALPWLRERTQRVLSGGALAPLPAGARVIAADYGIRSEHQVGFVIALGWEF